MPSQKQINYALILMAKVGYSTTWMNAEHKKLGATMRQRHGKVSEWLAGMDAGTISILIDRLKTEAQI